MAVTVGSLSGSAGAQNGMGVNQLTSMVELGGDLIRPTAINTSAANTLSLTGLVNGDPTVDFVLVIDNAGTIRYLTVPIGVDFFRSGTGATTPDGVTDFTENISHNGNLGLGIADPSTLAARLDVNGPVVFRQAILPNFAVNGTIVAANTTANSVIAVPQTTAGITIGLAAPTNLTAGRLLFFQNTGNVPVTVGGELIQPTKGMVYVWSGVAWIPMGSAAVAADFWRSGTGATLPDNTTDTTDAISHNGNVGIGLTNPSLLAAKLDINSATVIRPLALANRAAAGVIGTAAATVDLYSTINLTQTSPNLALTIPNPTNVQAGRLLTVANTGTVQVQLNGQFITPRTAQSYVWSGAAWVPVGDNPNVITVAASRNFAPTDHLKTLSATAAITLTVPANIGYLLCRVRQASAAAVITIAAGAGVTLKAPFGTSTIGIDGVSGIVEVFTTNIAHFE